jgi:cysteine synthase
MIETLKAKGLLGKGQKAVEGTSGNTGIGLSLVCAYEGIPLTIVMPENMSKERQDLMKAYGSTLILTPKEEGMAGAEKKAAELAKEGYVFLNQFENKATIIGPMKRTPDQGNPCRFSLMASIISSQALARLAPSLAMPKSLKKRL